MFGLKGFVTGWVKASCTASYTVWVYFYYSCPCVVAGASILFFKFGVETWFSSEVRTALNQSVAVAEAYMAEHKNNIRADVLAVCKVTKRSKCSSR